MDIVRTVLLVDDEDGVRNVTRHMLEQEGFSVLETHSPLEALKISSSRDTPFALLISDVQMPEMNGYDLAARFVQVRPGTPVLLISGYPGDTDHPLLPILMKPFRACELIAMVNELVR